MTTRNATPRRSNHGKRALVSCIPHVLVAAACGPPAAPSRPSSSEHAVQADVNRYLPLTHDTVFAYDTLSEATGETGVLVINITRPRSDMAELRVGGRAQR